MHPLDQNIRKRLSHSHTPVDDYNWDKISDQLDKIDSQKPKHIFLRSALGSVALICLVLIGGFLIANIYDLSFTKSEISQNKVQTNVQNVNKTHATVDLSSKTKDDENVKAQLSMHRSLEIRQNTNTNLVSDITNKFQTNQISNSGQSNNASITNENNDEDILQMQASSVPKSNIIELQDNGLKTPTVLTSDYSQSTFVHFPTISLINQKIVATNSDILFKKSIRRPNNKVTQKIVGGCPFTFETNNKSLEFFVSHDIYHKTLTADAQNVDIDLFNVRKESVQDMYSYTIGARFGYNLSHRWRMHLGASYSQQNERFSYIDPESNQERFITIKDYIRENGIIVDSVITTEKVIIPGTTKIQKKNKYASFDIPVVARFTLFGTKDLSVSTTVGPIFNISYDQKGTIIGDNLKPTSLNNYYGFKPQLGIKLYAGLSLAYHIAGDLDFVLEPHAKLAFDDITKNKAIIHQNNQVFGLHTGLRYRF